MGQWACTVPHGIFTVSWIYPVYSQRTVFAIALPSGQYFFSLDINILLSTYFF